MTERTGDEPRISRKRRGEPVVRQVLEVTLQQLAAHGYERLSVPEVATLAGLNKTSVYRRWATKADLVREALTVSMGSAADVPNTGNLRTDLLLLARVAMGFVGSPLGMGVIRMLLAEGAHPDIRDLAASMFRQQEVVAPLVLFQRAMARGELAPDTDVKLALTTIAGALMHRIFIEQEEVTEAFLERLIDLMLRGMLPR
jgi:AcrR family transcriptional regulator